MNPVRINHPSSRAFTLVELLISVAIVSLLIIGVSQVFRVCSDTISSGQALSEGLRAQRAISQQLTSDIAGALWPGSPPGTGSVPASLTPSLMICNMRVPTFRSKFDAYGKTLDSNAPIYRYGDQNFRVDTLSFFSQGEFTRQTNRLNVASHALVNSAFKSGSAWIWYGHLRVFNGDYQFLNYGNGYGSPGMAQTPPDPNCPAATGAQANTNNLYASQFMLGRAAILLRAPEDRTGNGVYGVYDDQGDAQWFSWSGTDSASNRVAPLGSGSKVVVVEADKLHYIDRTGLTTSDTLPPESRMLNEQYLTDVAGVGMQQFRDRLGGLTGRWYLPLFCCHEQMQSDYGEPVSGRFWIDPYPPSQSTGTQPSFNAATMGQRAQLLVNGCSQFIVEFAGDFVSQEQTDPSAANYGDVIRRTAVDASGNTVEALLPDGQIDFCVINGQRQIKWYGLPRDTDGDGVVHSPQQLSPTRSSDVQPLRAMLARSYTSIVQFPFERTAPPLVDDARELPITSASAQDAAGFGASANVADRSAYLCAWGPNELNKGFQPKMIRIIVELSDPNGHLQRPIAQEYTFALR